MKNIENNCLKKGYL